MQIYIIFGIFAIVMKIVVAPDSFKECLSAAQVAEAMSQAVKGLYPEAQVVSLPMADGGEGTLEALSGPMESRIETVAVHDPLGRPISAEYGISGTPAIVEVARACGLQLLTVQERNPLIASSRGVGEIIVDAFRKGCRRIIVGLGGTATCDGGKGILSVPGVREALATCSIELLCDVKAPFVGPEGAARVFAPQKGATPEQVNLLEERMTELAKDIKAETGVDVSDMPGAGAAGGLSGALMAYSAAQMMPGVTRVMELCAFSEAIRGADIIITGEGKSDSQTLMGKVPYGVLKHSNGVPVVLMSGRIDDRPLLEKAGFSMLIEISPRSLPLEKAMMPDITRQNIIKAVHLPLASL
jgi:glycerate kinase